MQVRFWGVRGSVATSGGQFARIGGNTSCLEVTCEGHRLILDAGTGLRALGDELLREGTPASATASALMALAFLPLRSLFPSLASRNVAPSSSASWTFAGMPPPMAWMLSVLMYAAIHW